MRARLLVGAIVAGVLAMLPVVETEAAPVFSRIEGLDRYGTAAALSSVSFTPGVPVAFLASGETFPDALAAAPVAAALKGPVLLTKHNALPNSTAGELDRLNPAKIVILGGTDAVATNIAEFVDQYTDGPVSRIEGADRYATSANISKEVWVAPVTHVYVATGRDFPDALSGGPAITFTGGGPILLVEPNGIPQPTVDELARLGAQKIIVLGGPGAITDHVVGLLDAYSTDPVQRKAGGDRYSTAAAVSGVFPTAAKVYVATGHNFPDALAAGSPAGIAKSPVLLVEPTCIPLQVNLEITRLNPSEIILLGGTSALSAAVAERQVCG